ncbi:MAG TPA: hypothetical protein VMY18_02500 [Acidobacteriota bacterium]|nr:hypothetical protein [Acidobacteriota bacterium]
MMNQNGCASPLNTRARDRFLREGEGIVKKYHHVGIPTDIVHPGEMYLEELKLYCTDHESNPFGIQWMRFEADCPLPELVKTVPHVAFEVDDLECALEGHEILIEPNSPSEGVVVAFVVCDGAPVEFLEFLEGS